MIDAEALAKAFAEFLAKSFFGLLRTPTWDDAMDVFDKAPKVDAVEVVRCKNCKYQRKIWHSDKRRKDAGYTEGLKEGKRGWMSTNCK